MSLFSTLTDAFTGQPIKDAAAQQRAFLQQQQDLTNSRIGTAQTSGLAALQSGQYGALGSIGSGVDTARADISGSTAPALSALQSGTYGATGALTGAQDPALTALYGGVQEAQNAYGNVSALGGQYAGTAGQASNASADALGLNGPEGIARAQASFQAGPGFQFALNKGLDSIARTENAVGMGASGNTLRESQEYGQGLANQEWNNYLQNLRAREGLYAPLGLSGTTAGAAGSANAALAGGTGAANIYTGTGARLSDLLSGAGTREAGIYTGAGSSLADLAARGGLAEGNVYTGTGGQSANLIQGLTGQQTNFTGQLATPYAGTYGAEGQAAMNGSNNLWNLIGNAGRAIAGAL